MFSQAKFAVILFALPQLLRFAAWRHPHFAARLKERNLVAQIKARDEGTGRWIEIRDGKIRSGRRACMRSPISRSSSRMPRSAPPC